MSTAPTKNIRVASISDRGLSEKRPLNEDSFLADAERRIFAVADGVGGAEAGEVASQTAVEVLDQAFRHRLTDGDDVEDLMELAIQRANASIHQMSNEHPRFSMMATTIVALHLDGSRATIGHVGDSRLYRVTPDGGIHRETRDHSVVEEEVQAGRMTPEQAANHPSKNVISRALGAEGSVEVDMKTIEVEEGTSFLLCSDGITRHISDNELRGLLTSSQPPEAVCEELKERCYERGAEDNLTAVIVQIGTPHYEVAAADQERTISARAATAPAAPVKPPSQPPAPASLTPPSRIAFPAPTVSTATLTNQQIVSAKSRTRGALLRFFVFLLFIAVAAGAFYSGMKYEENRSSQALSATQPSPATIEAARAAAFQNKRNAVDTDPQKWIGDNLPIEMAKEGITKPIDSKDAEFLYLYGRALMLTGNHRDAMQAFDQALNNLPAESKARVPLEVEVRLAEASAALKSKGKAPSQEASMAEQKAMRALDEALSIKTPTRDTR
jgi:serine/threonine protein phosphatase PrpC